MFRIRRGSAIQKKKSLIPYPNRNMKDLCVVLFPTRSIWPISSGCEFVHHRTKKINSHLNDTFKNVVLSSIHSSCLKWKLLGTFHWQNANEDHWDVNCYIF